MEVDIDYLDIPFTVVGYYTPAEDAETYDSDMAGYPGAPPEFDIEEIYLVGNDHNLLELFDSSQLEEIEELIINSIW